MKANIHCRVKELLDKSCEQNVFPGCAVGIIDSSEMEIITSGRYTYDKDAVQVTSQSVYDVASLTKAIPVSCLALKLIEQKKLSLDELLISFVPAFKGSYREEIKVIHLLTHTLDFDLRLSVLKECSPEDLISRILNVTLKSRPGERFCYANASSILLGFVIEACTGKTLDILGDEYFFKPLGMTRTGFDTSKVSLSDIVPSEIDPWRGGVVRGTVHDESAWKLRPRVVGSAGLFSTITDITTFVNTMLQSFINGPLALFAKDTAQMVITNQRPPQSGECTGMGWELNQQSFMGQYRSPTTFGKTGFTGCSIAADPSRMKAVILLSNHIFPHRRENRDEINGVRRALADIVFGSSKQ